MLNERTIMPDAAFAGLGGGRIAYVKPMRSEQLKAAFPNVPPIEEGLELWALVGADGTPIMVADTRDALIHNAWENDLETLSLH